MNIQNTKSTGSIGWGIFWGILYTVGATAGWFFGSMLLGTVFHIGGEFGGMAQAGAFLAALAIVLAFIIPVLLRKNGKSRTATGFIIIITIPIVFAIVGLGSCLPGLFH